MTLFLGKITFQNWKFKYCQRFVEVINAFFPVGSRKNIFPRQDQCSRRNGKTGPLPALANLYSNFWKLSFASIISLWTNKVLFSIALTWTKTLNHNKTLELRIRAMGDPYFGQTSSHSLFYIKQKTWGICKSRYKDFNALVTNFLTKPVTRSGINWS